MASLSVSLWLALCALASAQQGRLFSSSFGIPGNASYDYVGNAHPLSILYFPFPESTNSNPKLLGAARRVSLLRQGLQSQRPLQSSRQEDFTRLRTAIRALFPILP
jgi:hypothetical protein